MNFFRLRQLINIGNVNKISEKYFGSNMPSATLLEQKTIIALVNTHPVMDYLLPLTENVIPVAGLHIKEPKPLPDVCIFNNRLFCYNA